MIKYIKYLLFLVAFVSCDKRGNLSNEKASGSPGSLVASEEFWPVDNEYSRTDTAFNDGNSYHIAIITRSLNDSLAIFTAADETGDIIVHAHNRVSDITIKKNAQPYLKTSFTKEIFNGRDKELRIFSSSFRKYKKGVFVFGVYACVPDSDICDAAEVEVTKDGEVKVMGFGKRVDLPE